MCHIFKRLTPELRANLRGAESTGLASLLTVFFLRINRFATCFWTKGVAVCSADSAGNALLVPLLRVCIGANDLMLDVCFIDIGLLLRPLLFLLFVFIGTAYAGDTFPFVILI